MKKKHYLFIHGAWQTAAVFEPVLKYLTAQGFSCAALDLPGHGRSQAVPFKKINLACYVDAVCDHLRGLPPDLDVKLVGHSMAGMVMSQVAEKIPVSQLIYIAAFFPKNGDSLLGMADQFDHRGLKPFMRFDIEKNFVTLETVVEGQQLADVLYHDCSPKQRLFGVRQLRAQPLMPFNGKVRLGAQFDATPKAFIVCTQDEVIDERSQRAMCKGRECAVYEIAAGHVPMLSQPECLSELLSAC